MARKTEGIIAKRKDGRYHADKRTADFVKVINYPYVDVQIAGWRKGDFGRLAHYNSRPVGVIELGVTPSHKQAFYDVAKPLITGEDREFVYVQPLIKARVKFRNWTKRWHATVTRFCRIHFVCLALVWSAVIRLR